MTANRDRQQAQHDFGDGQHADHRCQNAGASDRVTPPPPDTGSR